ncbi:hypothetical protein [Nocardia wallacei]|uniref:hypothetical protein n=1 Tax=Nocardia wallacei TaxID=480035 RepID=UPI002454E288|nr:hypothetical protein [Nocardia wallacei]
MNDDQLGFDIDATAEMTPWQEWVDPQRHRAQTRKLLARAGLPGLPTEPWDYDKNDEIHQLNDFLAVGYWRLHKPRGCSVLRSA